MSKYPDSREVSLEIGEIANEETETGDNFEYM